MTLYSREFNYKVQQHLATLEEHKGYSLELNIIDYGRGEPKYDLRRWDRRDEENPKMLKGITLNACDYEALKNYFKGVQ